MKFRLLENSSSSKITEKLIYRGESARNYSNNYPIYAGKFFYGDKESEYILSQENSNNIYTDFGTLTTYDMADDIKLYQGYSSEDYCHKNSLDKIPNKMIKQFLISAEIDPNILKDYKQDLSLEDVYKNDLIDYTKDPNVIFAISQYLAKESLEKLGYDGVEWQHEDDLTPNQYQIWNLNKIKQLEINSIKESLLNERLTIIKDNNLYFNSYSLYDENNTEIGYFTISDEDKGYLDAIEIYDGYQNKGYGTEILNKLIKDFGIRRLDVDLQNEGAQRLYERVGFVKVATIYGNVDGDGNDRYIMKYHGNPKNYIIYYQDSFENYKNYSKLGWLENGKINLNNNKELWEEVKELNLTKENIKNKLEEINSKTPTITERMKVDKMKLAPEQDRRRKLTDEQKEQIKDLYKTGEYSLNQLAQEYGVSKKLILLIVNPESKAKNDTRIKAHWQDYYDREEHNKAIKNLRDYKKDLLAKGELQETLLYHRSNNIFDEFDASRVGTNQGRARNIQGYWFFDFDDKSKTHGEHLYQVNVDTSNFYRTNSKKKLLNKDNIKAFLKKYIPHMLDEKGNIDYYQTGYIEEKLSSQNGIESLLSYASRESGESVTNIIKDLGYSGVIYDDHEYVVFDKSDIKDFKRLK